MTDDTTDPAIRHLNRAALLPDGAGLTDAELLGRYVRRRDEAAFAALLHRHGPMVLGVCRRVLGNAADADDAFQATFLVFVRKAGAVRDRGLVGNWLYGVAHNTARKAKAMSRQRRTKEHEAAAAAKPDADGWGPVLPLLDAELSRLPEHYRAPIVLCDLEGLTIKEAARHIGCPPGTAATRLSRGRALLARRLARHGLAPAGAPAAMAPREAPAAPLITSTRKAAARVAAGAAPAAVVSAEVAALVEGTLKMMLLTRLSLTSVVVFLVALGGAGLAARSAANGSPAITAVVVAQPRVAPQPPQSGVVRLDSDQVVALAFTSDGRFLIGGGMDKKVRVWDAKSHVLRRVLEGPTDIVREVAVSPDGATVAAGADDGGISLWDVASGEPRGELKGDPAFVNGLVFLPGGARLAAAYNRDEPAGEGKTQRKCQIKLWDLTAKKATTLYTQNGSAYDLAPSPDGSLLAAALNGEEEGEPAFHGLRVWDLHTGKPVWEQASAPNAMSAVAFSPDGRSLAVGGGHSVNVGTDSQKAYRTSGRLWCFDVATRQQRWHAADEINGEFSTLAFTVDGKGVLTGSSGPIRDYEIDGATGQKVLSEVRRWDTVTGKSVWRTEGELGHFATVAPSPDGTALAGSDDEQVMVLDPETGRIGKVLMKRTLTPRDR